MAVSRSLTLWKVPRRIAWRVVIPKKISTMFSLICPPAEIDDARPRLGCAPRSPAGRGFVGHSTDHHRFLLAKMLARIDALDADIADVESNIDAQILPFASAVACLDEIQGVGATTAAVIIAEVGVDMT